MKKIIILLFTLVLSISAFSQTSINVWGGYSWLNGIIGAEVQLEHFGISAGYYPAKMPDTKENIPSFSAAVTYYTKSNKLLKSKDMCYYGSLGMASAGYRHDGDVDPIYIGMTGLRFNINKLQLKVGGGYGFNNIENKWMFEAGISYGLFTNR